MAEKELTVQQTEKDWRTPPCDIVEDVESYKVILDMPGVDDKNLEVTYQNGSLSIVGRVSRQERDERFRSARREYAARDFKREFALSEEHVDVDKINAELRNGELILTLPKSETVRPRKIEVRQA